MPIKLTVARKFLEESYPYLNGLQAESEQEKEDDDVAILRNAKLLKAAVKLGEAGSVSVAQFALEKRIHFHHPFTYGVFFELLKYKCKSEHDKQALDDGEKSWSE
jgi:hypothetical protein